MPRVEEAPGFEWADKQDDSIEVRCLGSNKDRITIEATNKELWLDPHDAIAFAEELKRFAEGVINTNRTEEHGEEEGNEKTGDTPPRNQTEETST